MIQASLEFLRRPVLHPDSVAACRASPARNTGARPTLHVAGPTSDGWVVIAIWDDQATWERFRDETLIPGLTSTEGGFDGPPEETTFDIDRQLT